MTTESIFDVPVWPNNGIDFNRWFIGSPEFVTLLGTYDFWTSNPSLKYINVRCDTRKGNRFILTVNVADEIRRISPDIVIQAILYSNSYLDDDRTRKYEAPHLVPREAVVTFCLKHVPTLTFS